MDFQLSIYTTPAVDLQYFLHTSPSLSVYSLHHDYLLKHYYTCLVQCFKELKYNNIPTFEQIVKDYNACSFYGLTSSATVLPIVRAPRREDATFDDLMKDNGSQDGIRNASYNCEGYRKTMEYFLPLFDKKGLLN